MGQSYNEIRRRMEQMIEADRQRIREQILSGSKVGSSSAYERFGKDYEQWQQYLLGKFDLLSQAVPSGAAYAAGPPLEPDAVRRLRLYTELQIGSGEELVSLAVRKNDGSIETRSA